jgi:hypothetical protein
MGGHQILTARAVAKRLNADGPLNGDAIDNIARSLASVFPSA